MTWIDAVQGMDLGFLRSSVKINAHAENYSVEMVMVVNNIDHRNAHYLDLI